MDVDTSALSTTAERLAEEGIEARAAQELIAMIENGSDVELFRINPLQYAGPHGLSESESIDLFLQATVAGTFVMEWNIVCRSCGNVFKSFRRLEQVDRHFHCNLCDLENQSTLDDVIHVTFTVSQDVKRIVFHAPDELPLDQLLFAYNYSNAAHTRVGDIESVDFLRSATLALETIDPGQSFEIDVRLESGSVLVRDWATSFAAVVMELDPSNTSLELVIGEDGLTHPGIPTTAAPIESSIGTLLLPAVHAIGPGQVHFGVVNESSQPKPLWMVKYPPTFVENLELIQDSGPLTAKRLLNTPSFRRLFRSESPGEGEGLSVTDLTFLFTDVKGSTSMYDEIGDATAYNLVRSHFGVVEAAVSQNNGVVVKTIGDAVMATFLSPRDAVAASLQMVEDVRTAPAPGLDSFEIKVGVHRGHAIAVTLNERLDYFGQNVNIAARTQEFASASEVFITEDVLNSVGVVDLLDGHSLELADGSMRGIAEEIAVYRVVV